MLLLTGRAPAESKAEAITFDTIDGVKIKGTWWPSEKGRKAPTVLLLHNFEGTKGGDSHQDGWDSLGDRLQAMATPFSVSTFAATARSTAISQNVFFNFGISS